ncbi:MAG: hypothetical protein U9N39_09205 [Campylobacterota bacterium]|nr:hypothetical protein [Campylobacterota bacterium]
MSSKTDSDRIMEVHELCTSHFGEVLFVGIKFHSQIGWVAKAQFKDSEVGNLTADGEDSSDAIRNLRNRVKKIMKRYNGV